MPVGQTRTYPRRREGLRRAAVVDDACRTEGGGFEENPGHGHVGGEVSARDGHGEQHHEGEVGAGLPQVALGEVSLGMVEDPERNDDEQQVEQRPCGVEREERPDRRTVTSGGEEPRGESGLDEVEDEPCEVDGAAAAGCQRRSGGELRKQKREYGNGHGVSLLRG